MKTKRQFALWVVSMGGLALWAMPAAAQTYPVKPIRMVVPYPAGGGTDIVARTLAQLMTPAVGQQVIVENRGGAGGNIGMEAVSKAAPDGYTLVFAITAQLAVNPSLYPKHLTYTSTGGFLRSGRLRALGVTTAKRSPMLPDLPALAEALPGYDSAVWYAALAPAATAPEIVARLNREFAAALKSNELRQRLIPEAFEPLGSTPPYLGDYLKKEIARWTKLVEDTGVKID